MSELQQNKNNLLEHLNELLKLQGFITLEQLNEHREALTVEKYFECYEYLDNESLVKLTKNFSDQSKGWVYAKNQLLTNKIVPTLLNRLEQQQTEIEHWKHRYLSLVSKITKDNSEENKPLLDLDMF